MRNGVEGLGKVKVYDVSPDTTVKINGPILYTFKELGDTGTFVLETVLVT